MSELQEIELPLKEKMDIIYRNLLCESELVEDCVQLFDLEGYQEHHERVNRLLDATLELGGIALLTELHIEYLGVETQI